MDAVQGKLLFRIRALLAFFIFALVISGVTAFPLTWELSLLTAWFGDSTYFGNIFPALAKWLEKVKLGLEHNDTYYPFIAYGTDWLAFAHLMIAIAYIGPMIDPVKNRWVVTWGMICCVCVIPLAFLCGMAVRGIPWGWCLVDCSFGVFGIIPLWFIRKWTNALEKIRQSAQN